MARIQSITSPVATSTSSATVLVALGTRARVVFQNIDSTDDIFLSFNGEDASASSNCVTKLAAGQAVFFEGEWAAAEWRAIASANAPKLAIAASLA